MNCKSRGLGWVPVVVALALSLPTVSFAGDRDHDGGFFLRLSAGVGAAATKIEDQFDELKFSGASGDINFAIGGMVSRNLALHGTLYGWTISDPDVELNGIEAKANGDLTLGAIGVGITYYLMPANVYFSPSIGIGSLTFDAGDIEAESETGIVLDLTVGKEWWVGRNWGLGVAGALGVHSIRDDGEFNENFAGASFAVRFTATMN